MKTDNLIVASWSPTACRAPTYAMDACRGAVGEGVVPLALFLATLGVRPDIEAALATWRFELKVGLGAAGVGIGFQPARIALSPPDSASPSRPGARRRLPRSLSSRSQSSSSPCPASRGQHVWSAATRVVCLVAIPTLAIVRAGRSFSPILRSGAPASPALAGGAAGLLAAAAAAALYAFHCFDEIAAALFVVTWYALAALPVIGLGAVFGHRLLRW